MRAVLFSSEGDRMLEGSTMLQGAIVSALLTVPATCSTCGPTLWATYLWQTFTYPNNNVNYPSNQACEWNIQSGGFGYIQIQTVYVHIQNSFACSKDYLQIGKSLSSTDYERVCGEQALQYDSNEKGKDVFLRFVSDGQGSDRGFRIKYRIVNVPSADSIKYLPATRNYTPVIYPSSQDASGSFEKSWIMYTQDTKIHVLVKFEESTINCMNDFIKVFDGMSTSDPLLGNLCDNRTKAFQSTGQYLRVLFHSQTAAPGSISFKFRAEEPPARKPASKAASFNIPVRVGLLVGGSFGFIFCMAYLGFFIFCLYRKRKGETDLINAPIICDSSDTGDRDNDGYENVFVHADITEERGDIQLRSGSRGSNSRRQHDDARHSDWPGEHAARDNRGYHDAGSHGDARDAYSQGQPNGREKNPCRMDVEVELNDTEPVIRGGKLILRQSSREGDDHMMTA